jgi:hypothetical protein
MNYLQTNESSFNGINPLLMNYTPVTKIEEDDSFVPLYDDANQIIYNMRIVGTRSLKSSSTRVKSGSSTIKTDRKNEIDDSKSVK